MLNTMFISQKLRSTVAAAIILPALAITACSSEDSDTEAGSTGASAPESSASESTDATDSATGGAPANFTATEPDTIVPFGEAAYITTSDRSGTSLYWKVTATGTADIDSAEAVAAYAEAGQTEPALDQTQCVTYEVEFLGAEGSPDSATSHQLHFSPAPFPTETVANSNGFVDQTGLCAPDEATALPETMGDIKPETVYTGGVFNYANERGTGWATGLEVRAGSDEYTFQPQDVIDEYEALQQEEGADGAAESQDHDGENHQH
ncbi:hypothetical protein CCYS_11820 [Corynebacterium cystitidis DSM 20524]|uniref:Uncharacterized protein n=2 Tax=Corynebacterium cystitidis TaxID=35757 RepID=A0A1H9W980_9CORY|nr:hypothetical protein CCYS_11820 [Corynebacterium cystitidis DSM 20524]SES30480.1 hypothetical protein SAMN05661109_02614 [Corynebacterium cystitidis DSM 20524]SNV64283.1 Uncharacterised protein [Corynebacterium cystitidis]